jgi:uncharacterized protein with NRDE domain
MCLILFAYKVHPKFPLILAANRDEYYQRPSLSARWWPDQPDLLAGKDLDGGGTWMGITRTGHLAAITNVRDGVPLKGNFLSRGELPLTFLKNPQNSSFNQYLCKSSKKFRGYNLIYGTFDHLQFFSNRSSHIENLLPGTYGLSNATLNTPWPKVISGKAKLTSLVMAKKLRINSLFEILSDETIAPDHDLPETGINIETERLLSATNIKSKDYGTRSSCILLINREGKAELHEKERAPNGGPTNKFTFQIKSQT